MKNMCMWRQIRDRNFVHQSQLSYEGDRENLGSTFEIPSPAVMPMISYGSLTSNAGGIEL